MSAAQLVSMLSGVKETGRGRWRAVCPAHESKNRSLTLAVRETDDGRVLLHCFAGCHADAVLGAVGMSVTDLFPPRENVRYDVRQPRSGIHSLDVLACIAHETTVVLIAANDMIAGTTPSGADYERLCLAAQRIHAAKGVANG